MHKAVTRGVRGERSAVVVLGKGLCGERCGVSIFFWGGAEKWCLYVFVLFLGGRFEDVVDTLWGLGWVKKR